MPLFIHAATGRQVVADGSKADQLDRLATWERVETSPPAPPVEQDPDPVRVDAAGQIVDAPPKAGPGSSRAAWVAYAETLDVEVEAGWSRDDIVERLEAR